MNQNLYVPKKALLKSPALVYSVFNENSDVWRTVLCCSGSLAISGIKSIFYIFFVFSLQMELTFQKWDMQPYTRISHCIYLQHVRWLFLKMEVLILRAKTVTHTQRPRHFSPSSLFLSFQELRVLSPHGFLPRPRPPWAGRSACGSGSGSSAGGSARPPVPWLWHLRQALRRPCPDTGRWLKKWPLPNFFSHSSPETNPDRAQGKKYQLLESLLCSVVVPTNY